MSRLKKGIKNIDKIAEATINRALSINKELAEKRYKVCNKCESKEKDNVFGGYMCGGGADPCFCNIKSIVYSDKKCPLSKWENIN